MLTLRDPFADFPSLFPTYLPVKNGTSSMWKPAMDVLEADNQLTLKLEVPGLSMDDVAVEISSDVLTISGERKQETETATRREMSYGKFTRAIRLPTNVDQEAIDAQMANGILTVNIPYVVPTRTTIAIRGPDS